MATFRKYSFNPSYTPPTTGTYTKYSFPDPNYEYHLTQIEPECVISNIQHFGYMSSEDYIIGIIWENTPSTYLSMFLGTPNTIEGTLVSEIYRTGEQEFEYQLTQIEPNCSIDSIKRIGTVINTPGQYNEEGQEITAPTYHPGFAVDILWLDQPSTYLSQFEVWPSELGVHAWWGYEQQYKEAYNMYKQNNP